MNTFPAPRPLSMLPLPGRTALPLPSRPFPCICGLRTRTCTRGFARTTTSSSSYSSSSSSSSPSLNALCATTFLEVLPTCLGTALFFPVFLAVCFEGGIAKYGTEEENNIIFCETISYFLQMQNDSCSTMNIMEYLSRIGSTVSTATPFAFQKSGGSTTDLITHFYLMSLPIFRRIFCTPWHQLN